MFVSKKEIKMNKEDRGVWQVIIDEDLNGEYYNYLVTNDFNSTTDKTKKAKQWNIPIISYEELFEKFLND